MAKGKKPPTKTKLTVVDGGKRDYANNYPPGHPEGPPLPEGAKAAGGAEIEATEDAEAPKKKGRWREKNHQGKPIGSLYNARKAITLLGVVCSYDTFHSRLLISARDGDEIEIDQRLIGDVSDDSLLALRQIISDTFG